MRNQNTDKGFIFWVKALLSAGEKNNDEALDLKNKNTSGINVNEQGHRINVLCNYAMLPSYFRSLPKK